MNPTHFRMSSGTRMLMSLGGRVPTLRFFLSNKTNAGAPSLRSLQGRAAMPPTLTGPFRSVNGPTPAHRKPRAGRGVLPYDYENYGKEILVYLDAAKNKSKERFGDKAPNFSPALEGARRLQGVGAKMLQKQRQIPAEPDRMNAKLRDAERALLIPEGLPNRPWYHHAIYAPGQYTGYAAVVIPGVNEAIDRGDLRRTEQQIAALAAALNRAVQVLDQYR